MKKLILIILLIFSYNCSKKKTYPVTGTLIEIKADHKEFIIHHDEIPGFMMAMTMPFKLNDTGNLFSLKSMSDVKPKT